MVKKTKDKAQERNNYRGIKNKNQQKGSQVRKVSRGLGESDVREAESFKMKGVTKK